MEPVKACVDCKFHRNGFAGSEFTKCWRSPRTEVNLVSGKVKHDPSYCDVERGCEHLCGEEGKHFVPRQSLAKRFRLWLRGTGEPWGWPQYAMFAIVAVLITGITHPIKPLWENFLAFMAVYFAIRFVMAHGGFRW